MQGHLAMLLFSALVAGSFSLGGLMANMVDPAAFTAVRMGIAAVLMGVVVAATGGCRRRDLSGIWRFVLLGGIYSVYFVLMFEGLRTATPVSTAAVFTLTPIIAAGFGWLLLRQITTPRMVFALLIGGSGALWVIFRADPAALLAFQVGPGERIFFWGVVCHALYVPLTRLLNRGERPAVFTFLMLVGSALMLTAYSWLALRATDWTALPMIVWITLAYVAVFASAVTFFLVIYAALRLPAAKVIAYTYLTPTWVLGWEAALGHELPLLWIAGGIALTIVALVLLLKDEDRQGAHASG